MIRIAQNIHWVDNGEQSACLSLDAFCKSMVYPIYKFRLSTTFVPFHWIAKFERYSCMHAPFSFSASGAITKHISLDKWAKPGKQLGCTNPNSTEWRTHAFGRASLSCVYRSIVDCTKQTANSRWVLIANEFDHFVHFQLNWYSAISYQLIFGLWIQIKCENDKWRWFLSILRFEKYSDK